MSSATLEALLQISETIAGVRENVQGKMKKLGITRKGKLIAARNTENSKLDDFEFSIVLH